jgi:hypothetical protein
MSDSKERPVALEPASKPCVPSAFSIDDARTIVDQVRQGLYAHRMKHGDSDALRAMSRTLDLARHAIYASMGRRPFSDAVPDIALLSDREASVRFRTQGGSSIEISQRDARALARATLHYGKIVFLAATHSATLAGGSIYLLNRLAALLHLSW